MGIDVGKWLHYEINEWLPTGNNIDIHTSARPRIISIGKCAEFEDLDDLIHKYYVNHFVVDAAPERRKSIELCNRFYGSGDCCFYGHDIKSREIIPSSELPAITVDKHMWLDISLGRLINHDCELPLDTPLEYKLHVQNIVKVYGKDPDGNIISRWERGTKDDHHAQARNYAEIAFSRAISKGSSQNINKVI